MRTWIVLTTHDPLALALNKPVFRHALGAIDVHKFLEDKVLIVCSEKHQRAIDVLCSTSAYVYPSLDGRGPVAAIHDIRSEFKGQVIIVTADQHIRFDAPLGNFISTYGLPYGCLSPHGFVRVHRDRVVRVHEKDYVTSFAAAGVYGFERGFNLAAALEDVLGQADEIHLSAVVNDSIDRGLKFRMGRTYEKYDLNSPKNIERYERMRGHEHSAD